MPPSLPHPKPEPPLRIRLLSEGMVNRIAAGEVIERPAAAVKELVENALDAGATRIAVTLTGGGIERIEVEDNGCGMGAADLALAVQRHCTSKLVPGGDRETLYGDRDTSNGDRDTSYADRDALVRITTLGFRGEALPSIGAAGRLHVTSRLLGAPHAHAIRVEGGTVTGPAPAAGPPGTRAVVADLFYATPARRKFLKHPRTEAEHAEHAVRRLALAAPHVAFRCVTEGRVAFDLPAQDRAARVAALLGPEAAAALLPLDESRGDLRLSGFACAPTVTRATAAAQSLVVNGRPVTDLVLRTALRVAYREVIAAGRHPVAALFLDLPPTALDVNVHPAKTELRFQDPAAIRSLVIGALTRALAAGAGDTAPRLQLTGRPPLQLVPQRVGHRPGPRYTGFAEAQLPLAAPPAARSLPEMAPAPGTAYPLGAAVAQVLDTYILAVAADGSLVLVDQHAAHERLTHEALRAQHHAGGIQTQALLLPAVVDLAPADAARLLAHADELRSLGLEIEGFGPGAVLVRVLPAALGAPDPAPLLRDLADELAESGEATALLARLDAMLARLACHGSIRAGRRLLQAEMDALLRQMETTPRAATCSHGRPTFLKLSRAEIERLFGRR